MRNEDERDRSTVRCEACGRESPYYDTLSCGSNEHGYRQLCHRCFNAEVAGLQIADQTVRAQIAWDETEDGRVPLLVIDGQEVKWDEFGRMLMTFEGWPFRLDICDPSDEP